MSVLIFRCVIKELESLGKALYGAKLIAQRFQVRNCSHHKNPVSGSACLLSMIEDGNPHHFFIATQVKAHGKCSSISFEVMLWYLRKKKPAVTSIMRFLNSLWELIMQSLTCSLMYFPITKQRIFSLTWTPRFILLCCDTV